MRGSWTNDHTMKCGFSDHEVLQVFDHLSCATLLVRGHMCMVDWGRRAC